jgi:hypothetical protein
MKKKILIILLILSSSSGLTFAQTPAASSTPAPSAPPVAAPGGLQPNQQIMAAVYAGQIISQVNTLITGVIQVIDNGAPAQNGQPAVAAKDIQTALGPENVMKLRALAGTLSAPVFDAGRNRNADASTPTPAATPERKK